MEQNISVEAEKCCTQFAERYVPQRHFAIYSFISGRILCSEDSPVKGEKAEPVWHFAATTGEVEQSCSEPHFLGAAIKERSPLSVLKPKFLLLFAEL
jgi:hypothetical protein